MLIFGIRTSTISDFMRDKAKVWFTSSLLMLVKADQKRSNVQDLSVCTSLRTATKNKNKNKCRIYVKYIRFNID